jgi:hypothetical protein
MTRKNNKRKKVNLGKINFKNWLLNNICVFKLDPNYITGLAQSDGTFFVTVSRDSKAKWGYRFRPTVPLQGDRPEVFYLNFFGFSCLISDIPPAGALYRILARLWHSLIEKINSLDKWKLPHFKENVTVHLINLMAPKIKEAKFFTKALNCQNVWGQRALFGVPRPVGPIKT